LQSSADVWTAMSLGRTWNTAVKIGTVLPKSGRLGSLILWLTKKQDIWHPKPNLSGHQDRDL
jgi:hypothetical protein